MPRYFFHTESHVRTSDDDGLELPDIHSARVAAARSVAELLRGHADLFWGSKPWSMTVTDDGGLILFSLEVHGHSSPAIPDQAPSRPQI